MWGLHFALMEVQEKKRVQRWVLFYPQINSISGRISQNQLVLHSHKGRKLTSKKCKTEWSKSIPQYQSSSKNGEQCYPNLVFVRHSPPTVVMLSSLNLHVSSCKQHINLVSNFWCSSSVRRTCCEGNTVRCTLPVPFWGLGVDDDVGSGAMLATPLILWRTSSDS